MNQPSGYLPLADVADLMAPGRRLPFGIFDGAGRLLLAQGQFVHDVRQLRALLERGACAEIEEVRQVRAARAADNRVPSQREPTWFDRFERQTWALDDLQRSLIKGEAGVGGADATLPAQIEAFGDAFVALVERQPDAALFIAVRQDEKRHAMYALTHSLNAATVALLAARLLGWPAAQARLAVLAVLTMNAAIVELQGHMAAQKEAPSKAQIDQIRAHPHRSATLLASAGVSDEFWLQAVRDHHERSGIGGYPRGESEPGELARLVRAADVFTAKISPRAMRAAMTPQAAARQLFQEEGGGPLAGALIKAVGVYPPGDLVTLKNGETAIVVTRTAAGNAPQVAALFNAQGRPIAGAPRRDTSVGGTAIAGPLADRSRITRILPEMVYGLLA